MTHLFGYLMTLEEPATGIHDEGKVLDGHSLCDTLHKQAQLVCKGLLKANHKYSESATYMSVLTTRLPRNNNTRPTGRPQNLLVVLLH